MKRVTLSRVLVLGALIALYGGATGAANTSAGGYGEGTGGSSPLPIRTDSGAGSPRGYSDGAKTDEIKMRGGMAIEASQEAKTGKENLGKDAIPSSEGEMKTRGGGGRSSCIPGNPACSGRARD